MDQEHGEAEQYFDNQAHRCRLCAHTRELHHLWQPCKCYTIPKNMFCFYSNLTNFPKKKVSAREHRRGVGPAAGAAAPEADVQAGRQLVHQTRRSDH